MDIQTLRQMELTTITICTCAELKIVHQLTRYPKMGDKANTQNGELLIMTPIRREDTPLLSAYVHKTWYSCNQHVDTSSYFLREEGVNDGVCCTTECVS